jgi:hypothetical protein
MLQPNEDYIAQDLSQKGRIKDWGVEYRSSPLQEENCET